MPNVLVTGVGGPAGMAVIQSLQVAPEKITTLGVDMNPLAPGLRLAKHSAIVPASTSTQFVPTLIGLCKKYRIDVLIPTVDEEVSVLSERKEIFIREDVAIPIPDSNTISLARDKYEISKIENVGVKTPQTIFVQSEQEIQNAVDRIGLPCVIKQRFGRGGRGFAVIDSIEDANFWFSKAKQPMVFQQKIDGDLLLVQGIAKEGKGLVSIVHKRLATKTEGSGTAVSAVTLNDKTVTRYLNILFRKLNWTGAIGVEFLKSSNDGDYYMIDVNPRICGQSHLSTLAGINLAYSLVELSTKGEISQADHYKEGKIFVRVWKDEVFDSAEVPSIVV